MIHVRGAFAIIILWPINHSVQVLRPSGIGILKFYRECDMVFLGLGHEPELKSTSRSRLGTVSSALGSCTWQTPHGFHVSPPVQHLVVVRLFILV